jgi:hypothetical protein
MLFLTVLLAANPLPAKQAQAAFESVRALEGEWNAESSAGWLGRRVIQVIGRGSAVLATSRIEPHPGEDEAMATLFHMDQGRLMLTHYCVAGNQPRLVATSVSDDGRTIEFSFLDGTNMRSRDDGHMDRAIFTIESRDRFRTRWTFYKEGREQWMEDIVHVRTR